ncbi:Mis6-domain-containing protein [Meira miltonrushii]|uniref:Mis6-domain-containing protein n=1 Tax=Meira miltonrushii TaxID=1280837 RepID=A0A316VDN5_9BASI|nr:Mis6-domain-containing protein [Meira miltonrushii]PWN35656.1 Mis6-domain-containing protein [Meira miltonrushii]
MSVHQLGRKQRNKDDDNDSNMTDNSQTIQPFEETIRAFQVSLERSAELKLENVEALNNYSLHYGFTSSQALRVVKLAIQFAKNKNNLYLIRIGKLFNSVRPAPQTLFGPSLIYAILDALGGNTNTGLDTLEDDDDSMANDDENVSSKIKKVLPVRTQGDALQLLLNLYAPPSITMHAQKQGELRIANLPKSFFNVKALKILEKCYGVLFHYLEYETLRPTLCHLLCLLTRRKHVRYYRIARALALRNRDPTDISLNALINTYAAYYPDMLFAESTSERQMYVRSSKGDVHGLKYPGLPWLMSVYKIWNASNTHGKGPSLGSAGQGQEPRARMGSGLLENIAPPPLLLMSDERTIAVSEMSSFRELGYRFDRVRMPDQISSALGHRMTMLAVLCKQSGQSMMKDFARMYEWTLGTISDQMSLPLLYIQGSLPLVRADHAHAASATLLDGLESFVRFVGCFDDRMQSRVCRMLHFDAWNNYSKREKRSLLKLVERSIPRRREAFQAGLIQPLSKIAKDCKAEEAILVLRCFANLIRHWANQDWQSILRMIEEKGHAYWGSVRLVAGDDMVDTIAMTISQAVTLSNQLLCKHIHSISLLHASLSLHEAIFDVSLIGMHDLLLPPTFALYSPGFSQHGGVMTLSRQLGLVHSVRRMHEDYLVAKENGRTSETINPDGSRIPVVLQDRRSNFFAEECSDQINDCVILLIDLVWRNNGFASVESGNADIGLPNEFFVGLTSRCAIRGDELQRIGSPSHSATLGILMEAYANDLARKRGSNIPILHGPLTPAKLKEARKKHFVNIHHRDFRDSFLNWLFRYGANGISDLLNATITRFIRGQEIDQSTILG